MTFQEEDLDLNSKDFKDLTVLLQEHYSEISLYQDIKLEPDYEKYLKMQEQGLLKTYTVRADHKIVGYACFLVSAHLHYKSSLQAIQDIIFIKKGFRGNGMAFIRWCDEQLKKIGVQVVYHHVKNSHNWGPALEQQDYELMDLIYSKRLDK